MKKNISAALFALTLFIAFASYTTATPNDISQKNTQNIYVAVEKAYIFSKPDAKSKVIASSKENTKFFYHGVSGNFCKIKLNINGKIVDGWISKNVISFNPVKTAEEIADELLNGTYRIKKLQEHEKEKNKGATLIDNTKSVDMSGSLLNRTEKVINGLDVKD